MSQAFSKRLTRLKLLQLNMVLKMGTPLKHWLNGLTLMLEKEAGNININKLRAICLFEREPKLGLERYLYQKDDEERKSK